MSVTLGLAACLAAVTPAAAARPADSLTERDGAVILQERGGRDCALTEAQGFVHPALSPDGKTVAAIKVARTGEPNTGEARSALWLIDVQTGAARELVASAPAEDLRRNLAAMWQPEFALDGKGLYVEADAWTTSSAIHRVDLPSGAHRFVTDGEKLGVVPRGKFAGYLLVQKHKYHGAPKFGSYNPVYVVRPDGKWSRLIPGSDKDEGETSVGVWLKRNAG